MMKNRSEPAAAGIRRLLAIDTSTAALTVSLSEDGTQVDESFVLAERNHSIKLVPEIDGLLKRNGIRPADVDAVAVGVGPGSYTGIRIGVTAAKTWAWSLGLPTVGVSSLEALALGGLLAEEQTMEDLGDDGLRWYVPLLDARRKQAFSAVYASGSAGMWKTVQPDAIRLVEPWLDEQLSELAKVDRPGQIVFVGEIAGFAENLEQWGQRLEQYRIIVAAKEGSIRASAIAELAWRRIRAGGPLDEAHGLLPNYTQLAEAESKLRDKEKQGGESCGPG